MTCLKFRSKHIIAPSRFIAAALAMMMLSHLLVWGHSHALLSGRVLAAHLARFHQHDARPIRKNDWHTHNQWRAPATPGESDLESDSAASLADEIIANTRREDQLPCSRVLSAGRSEAITGPWGPTRHRRALHLQLSMFLI